ncbi:MAG: PHB depolymerase family esterase [Bacteroidota bacterium]|jgi:polyhydroxybutyrate depolymerase|nr:PHB depolymerase family esterase [Bacteroidota bacterium]
MHKGILFCFVLVVAFTACSEDDATPPTTKDYVAGKNRYTTAMNGDAREYYVHVPASYDGSAPRPVVFMLHGSSGNGEKFYNISGWKELGEKENVLTVFPSSWRYCITDEDGTATTTKWHCFPGSFEFCAGEQPRDDIAFLRRIIEEMKTRFSVDEQRIYVVGFSNGGQMAFRCAVEMSDVIAAVVQNAGSVADDIIRTPLRTLPVAIQVGNEDDRFFPSPAALSAFESGLRSIPYFKNVIAVHTGTFQYHPDFTISGDTNTAMIASFAPLNTGEHRSLNIVLVKDLKHEYPNGTNHWMKGAERHWEWMKQFTRP